MKNNSPKLLLFDIDGTLITGRGIPKKVFLQTVGKRYPNYPAEKDFRFSGLTDPVIVQKILEVSGAPDFDNHTLINEILNEFLDCLQKNMNKDNPPHLLSGVSELLEACHKIDECFLGLVTGNMERGAEIKLSAADLDHYFPVGAFGSDNYDRNLLPPLAVKRAEKFYNISFSKENIWIIGESIHDVRCAKANGLRCLAAAASTTTEEELHAEQPDAVLKDLSDLQKIMNILGF